MSRYFGTDGFRGEANVVLTVEHAYTIGRFLGWYYKRKTNNKEPARIVIGKDTRRSCYMFENAIASGITASGSNAYLMHVTTTPSVAYITKTEDFDCGVMISASHNPFYDNGIKLINSNGEKMDDFTISLIEDYIDGKLVVDGKTVSALDFALREDIGRIVDYVEGRNRYMGYLISLAKYSFKNIKVGLDCANGSASSVAKHIFDALGADTYIINAEPDGINENKNCGSTHIDSLMDYVVKNKLDVGFAFDGDADRCLAVDEKGQLIDGDKIIYIFGKYFKECGLLDNNKVVTTIMSNIGLYKALDKVGIEYEKTTVGDKYVYECMMENGYLVGGEQAGHIILSKFATTGDGLLTAIKLMEVIIDKKAKLSELASEVVVYPQYLKNVHVNNKSEVSMDAEIKQLVDSITDELSNDGRILLRESGTEPLIRVMVEAESYELCEKYVDTVVRLIDDKGYSVKE